MKYTIYFLLIYMINSLIPSPDPYKKIPEQMIIDPKTKKNITGNILKQDRKEYEKSLRKLIKTQKSKLRKGKNPNQVWKETVTILKQLHFSLWQSHKGGWLYDYIPELQKDYHFVSKKLNLEKVAIRYYQNILSTCQKNNPKTSNQNLKRQKECVRKQFPIVYPQYFVDYFLKHNQ